MIKYLGLFEFGGIGLWLPIWLFGDKIALFTACYYVSLDVSGPHRLTVRTSGFHPGNRGSIPRGVTIFLKYSPFMHFGIL